MGESSKPQGEEAEKGRFGNLTAEERFAFDSFKEKCRAGGFLVDEPPKTDDMATGICDDGTLLRFLRARKFNVQAAMQQYQTTRTWRENNRLVDLYENIEAEHFEETRKLYTHWTGRRDKNGLPSCWFEIKQLTAPVMTAYRNSCAASPILPAPESKAVKQETTEMLRLFCTYDHLVRFVMPLCSAVPNRPNAETPVTSTSCIVDISEVGLLQNLRLRTHLQAASTLATAHYPETLGRTYIIGAPIFFPTIWAWIKNWFDQNTVSKIVIVPAGQELAMLSETYDVENIPKKYGGKFDYEFGMPPDLDAEISDLLTWLPVAEETEENGGETTHEELPVGPMRWRDGKGGKKIAVAVGKVGGKVRKDEVLTLDG